MRLRLRSRRRFRRHRLRCARSACAAANAANICARFRLRRLWSSHCPEFKQFCEAHKITDDKKTAALRAWDDNMPDQEIALFFGAYV